MTELLRAVGVVSDETQQGPEGGAGLQLPPGTHHPSGLAAAAVRVARVQIPVASRNSSHTFLDLAATFAEHLPLASPRPSILDHSATFLMASPEGTH